MFHRDNFNRFSFSSIYFLRFFLLLNNYINFIFCVSNQFIIYLGNKAGVKKMTKKAAMYQRMRRHIRWMWFFFTFTNRAQYLFTKVMLMLFSFVFHHQFVPWFFVLLFIFFVPFSMCSCEYIFVCHEINDFYHTLTLGFDFGFVSFFHHFPLHI